MARFLIFVTVIIEAIEQLTKNQINQLHQLYQLEWWTKDRQLADIQRMLEHSDKVNMSQNHSSHLATPPLLR